MNVLIALLIIIGGLIALILVAAAVVKKEYTVLSEITIDKNSQFIFNYIKLLKNQDTYNKWVMMDPNVKREYVGTDGAEGFIMRWDSENRNVGKGEQEIRSISAGQRVYSEVRFEKPFKNVAQTFMSVTPVSEHTTNLQWGMAGKNPYPFNLMNLFIPGMLRKDMDASLATLKNVLENGVPN